MRTNARSAGDERERSWRLETRSYRQARDLLICNEGFLSAIWTEYRKTLLQDEQKHKSSHQNNFIVFQRVTCGAVLCGVKNIDGVSTVKFHLIWRLLSRYNAASCFIEAISALAPVDVKRQLTRPQPRNISALPKTRFEIIVDKDLLVFGGKYFGD